MSYGLGTLQFLADMADGWQPRESDWFSKEMEKDGFIKWDGGRWVFTDAGRSAAAQAVPTLKQHGGKKINGEWRLPNSSGRYSTTTRGARRFSGAPMDENQMAARFGFAPEDDDKAKLAKVMAALGSEEPATMSDDPEEDEAVKALAGEVGVEDGPKVMSRTLAAFRAKFAPTSEVAALKAEVVKLSQAVAARDKADADAALAAFADGAIAGGQWDPAKRDALITFARADRKAAESSLQPKGTYHLLGQIASGKNLDPSGSRAPVPVEADAVDEGQRVVFGRQFAAAATAFSREHKVSLEVAQREVAKANPALARAYFGR